MKCAAKQIGACALADQNGRLPPSGFMVGKIRPLSVESVTSRRVGGRYGSRTRDFQILNLVLLPSELTVSDIAVSEPIHGTFSTKLFRVACMPLDERHQRTSV